MNQRWRSGRASYRPAGELIRVSDYEVAPIPDDTEPKRFVMEHHYSACYPAAQLRYGLYDRSGLVGVAVFSVPCTYAVFTTAFRNVPPRDCTELGRFVLLDRVPGNGETWFLARCFEQLRREGLAGVVSFSDPMPRTHADGSVVFKGHIGTIYQAFNAAYLGRGTPRTLHLLPDGSVLSDRAIQKIRKGPGEKGFDYATQILRSFGADAPWDDALAWLKHWTGNLTRRVRHKGNHKYAWGLRRSVSRSLTRLEYPKPAPLFGVAA